MDRECLSGGVACARDYLLGSAELHWRYGAEQLMHRLLRAVRPGGYLLVVGIEPYDKSCAGCDVAVIAENTMDITFATVRFVFVERQPCQNISFN